MKKPTSRPRQFFRQAYILIVTVVAIGFTTVPVQAQANYTSVKYFLDVTMSSEGSVADGSSSITFTMEFKTAYCAGSSAETAHCGDKSDAGKSFANYFITASGSGNKFGGTQARENGVQYLASSNNSFTLASTTAETKTVTIKAQPYGPPENAITAEETKTVLFVPAPKQTAVAAQPELQTSTTAAEASAPEVLRDTSFSVGGKQFSTSDTISLKSSETLTVKGTTVPNGVVRLFIFSTPREVNVTANAAGSWSYDIKDLDAGPHHIEAEVTDQKNRTTSSRITLVSFVVAKSAGATASSSPQTTDTAGVADHSSKLPAIIIGIVLLLTTAGAAGWWYWRKYKKPGSPDESSMASKPNYKLFKRPPKT